jgi:hypothetical protein
VPPAALASRLAAGLADAAADGLAGGAGMVLAAAAAPLPAPAPPALAVPAAASALTDTDAGVVACAGRTWVPHAAIAAPQPAIVMMVSTFAGRRLAG